MLQAKKYARLELVVFTSRVRPKGGAAGGEAYDFRVPWPKITQKSRL